MGSSVGTAVVVVLLVGAHSVHHHDVHMKPAQISISKKGFNLAFHIGTISCILVACVMPKG